MEYVLILIAAAVGAFFGAYFRRKGQNFADKEDIKKLTEIVESVRSQHTKELENLAHENRKALEYGSREHQLRLAALDCRLEAHQEAFTLWQKLIFAMHSKNLATVVIQCQDWWGSHCLYLEPEAREAFVRAFQAASNHEFLSVERLEQNGDIIRAAGPAIVQGVALPLIKDFKTEGIS